jgi:hypothetical protein
MMEVLIFLIGLLAVYVAYSHGLKKGQNEAFREVNKILDDRIEAKAKFFPDHSNPPPPPQRPPVPGVYSPEQVTLKPLFNEERSLFQKRRALDLQLRELPVDNDGYRVKKRELLKVDEQIKQIRAKINKHVLADIQSTPC